MSRSLQNQTKIKMRPELELVLCAARSKGPENDERMRALLHEELNWTEILASAHEHKLVPLLEERLRNLDASELAHEQRERLAPLARDLGTSNLVYLREMLWLCGTFEDAQIPAVPFKGPALGWLAYRNFAQRTCVDLDFVLPQRYIPDALSLLEERGYTAQFERSEADAGARGPAPGQYAFASSRKRIFVELHTERTLRYFSRQLPLDEMNSRLIRFEIGGRPVHTFSVEDQLVMLSVHGAKHFWERLAWIVDIAKLITVRSVDWPSLFGIANKMQSTRLTLLGLFLAHEVIGAPLPLGVLERTRGDANVQWLAGKIVQRYTESLNSSHGVWPRALFRFRSCDRFWPGVWQVFRLTTSPTESDRGTIRLPGFLSPFYSIVRPLRLLGEYGLGLNRRSVPELAPYVPTPEEIVGPMLELAGIVPGDVLYDLGCGDGRIIVAAAEKYGIRAVGVDINPKRIAEAWAKARRHGVEKRVQFILGDAKTSDVREATVVTMYLGDGANLRLADHLSEQLRPGARIVSRDFKIPGWAPECSEHRITSKGAPTSLYLWTMKNPPWEVSHTATAAPETSQPTAAESPGEGASERPPVAQRRR